MKCSFANSLTTLPSVGIIHTMPQIGDEFQVFSNSDWLLKRCSYESVILNIPSSHVLRHIKNILKKSFVLFSPANKWLKFDIILIKLCPLEVAITKTHFFKVEGDFYIEHISLKHSKQETFSQHWEFIFLQSKQKHQWKLQTALEIQVFVWT